MKYKLIQSSNKRSTSNQLSFKLSDQLLNQLYGKIHNQLSFKLCNQLLNQLYGKIHSTINWGILDEI